MSSTKVSPIHELTICHKDIGPANVALDSNNESISIDMDSFKPVDDKLIKGGTPDEAEIDDFFSAKSNGTNALAVFKTYLVKAPPA